DSSINQVVAAGILKKLGYRADVAGSGREALEALQRIPYAAVLMDCQMPEMDGFQTTAEIRRREGGGPRTPIIAMTAQVMRADRERCLAAGMDDHLSKPVRKDDLSTALGRWGPQIAASTSPEVPASAEPAPPPAEARPPVLDAGALVNFDASVANELVDMFLQDAPGHLAALRDALVGRDAPTLQEVAHRLKGDADILGARQFRELAYGLEQLGRGGSTTGGEAMLSDLERVFEETRAALEARADDSVARTGR